MMVGLLILSLMMVERLTQQMRLVAGTIISFYAGFDSILDPSTWIDPIDPIVECGKNVTEHPYNP